VQTLYSLELAVDCNAKIEHYYRASYIYKAILDSDVENDCQQPVSFIIQLHNSWVKCRMKVGNAQKCYS